MGKIALDSDIVRTAGANGILRRALSRKMSSGIAGGGISNISPKRQSFSPRAAPGPSSGRGRRRASVARGGPDGKMLYHRNSLTALREKGVACPPSPTPLLFHKVVPAPRAATFFRQRSHVHSQDSIPEGGKHVLSSPLGGRFQRHSAPGRKESRGGGRAIINRRRSRRKTADQVSEDDESSMGTSYEASGNVIRDIEVMMEQLGHIKRRLSTHPEDRIVVGTGTPTAKAYRGTSGSYPMLSPLGNATATPTRTYRYSSNLFTSVKETDEGRGALSDM